MLIDQTKWFLDWVGFLLSSNRRLRHKAFVFAFLARTNSNEQLCIEVYKYPRDSWFQQLQALNDKNNAIKLADATVEQSNEIYQNNEPAPTVFARPTFFYQIKPPANIGKIQSKVFFKCKRILRRF
jgi:hypothetical protein